MREPSQLAMARFLTGHYHKGERILIATATDSSALGILDAARQQGIEANIAIASQDCIPEVLDEMRTDKSAIIGSVSHEVESYGPRLIQLGISLMRGYTVPPYNYVRHRVVTPDALGMEKASSQANRPG
jgi:ribose transport system substrate-binding protein